MVHMTNTDFITDIVIPCKPGHETTCLILYANNTGADQPAHSRSLISAFVVRCLDSVMFPVSVTKISSLMLASVAEQASLSLTWSETTKDTFSHDEAHVNSVIKTVESHRTGKPSSNFSTFSIGVSVRD